MRSHEHHKYRYLFLLIVFYVVSLNTNLFAGDKTMPNETISALPAAALTALSSKKIYFGHQSVGFNIIDGIKDIMSANKLVKLNIIELDQIKKLESSGFYHARVGSNRNAISKIDDFAAQMDAGIGGTADIAFFKFCFVDIGADTDIQKVFAHYQVTMAKLRKKYPTTKFIHFTVPLGTTITTWKTRIKTLMGKKDIWEYDANIKKNEFNDLLTNHYTGKEPVFDIAYFESTYPDGKRSTFSKEGKSYFDLAPEYTYDDGHLNEKGRRWVAEHLLVFLAQLN